jgi:hypothetical protein
MHGTISCCLTDLVVEVYGAATWDEIVSVADRDAPAPQALRIARSDVESVETLALIDATCKVLGISLAEIADLLGEYWCCVYAPHVHDISWNEFGSAREWLEALDEVHGPMRPSNPEAAPARSLCDWRDDKTVRVEYRSDRGLIDLYVGLVRGVGTALGESLRVTKVTSSAVEVVFA